MEREELMSQFADVVGRALARRWLAQRLASGKQKTKTVQESIGKKEKDHLHKSRRSGNEAECE